MQNQSKKIYCGSGKVQKEGWLKVTINPDKLKGHVQEFNGNKFIKLDINIKPEADQYGKNVSISVDTWKPEPKSELEEFRSSVSNDEKPDALPF